MKNFLIAITVILLCFGCSSDNVRNRNPNIPNYSFSLTINANLPTYSALKSAMNPIRIPSFGQNPPLIVMKISETEYRAWDANCPDQRPLDCEAMTLNGVTAKCACDDIEYSLFTGVSMDGSGQYTMKPYRIDIMGTDLIRISN
ncbi:MAG: hypothetical protein EOO46_07270 [Flavobacterium sp.]|nr:MAG: hypothetical protein EOO46_07270 [Flavobacterium sp.]